MIPKIIHCCWFGGTPIPDEYKKCMQTWKKHLPDYEIRLWNEENFNIHVNKYVEQAYETKEFRFVSDYARLYALYNYGGIYFDIDVKVKKSFNRFLQHEFFTGFGGDNREIAACTMGCVKNHPFPQEIMTAYDSRELILPDGSADMTTINRFMSAILEKKGFIPNGKEQKISDIYIYPMTFFCPTSFMPESVKDCHSKNTYSDPMMNAPWLKHEKSFFVKAARKLGLNSLKNRLKGGKNE